MISCDITNFSELSKIFEKYNPHTVFNLACQSSVGKSFSRATETVHSITNASLNILETVRHLNYDGKIFFAGSSEIFGNVKDKANIDHPQRPNSPYAIAKQASFNLVRTYRENYGINCMTGILFNHESHLRAETFVTQKIIQAAKDIHQNKNNRLQLGNIKIIRDWGWAPEYIDAIQIMTQSIMINDHVILCI